MILKRNNVSDKNQIEIAYDLGLTVPEEYREMYPNAIFGDKPSAGYGTQIQKTEYSINNFFETNNIRLYEEYYYIENENETKDFLENNVDNDILVCCHCKTLYDAPHADWGHMLLFETIENDNVTLLDPGAKRNYEIIPLSKLVRAITIHGKENGAGFYLIRKLEKK